MIEAIYDERSQSYIVGPYCIALFVSTGRWTVMFNLDILGAFPELQAAFDFVEDLLEAQ